MARLFFCVNLVGILLLNPSMCKPTVSEFYTFTIPDVPKKLEARVTSNEALDVLAFWFGNQKGWYSKDPKFDQLMRERYWKLYARARDGELDHWRETPKGCLALILILGQFPKYIYRGKTEAYQDDGLALYLTKYALRCGYDRKLRNLSTQYEEFLVKPFMHVENLVDQEQSVHIHHKMSRARAHAEHYRDIVKRFGRFPHRNVILGRESTNEELDFLSKTKSAF